MYDTPPDKRPYRLASAPGDECAYTVDGTRYIFRQIGWHGQSGAFYSLAEDPSKHEPGSFSPIWLPVDTEPLDDEKPDEPALDMDLEAIRDAGVALGQLAGRYHAARELFNRALIDAAHGELKWAGICNCDPEEDAARAEAEQIIRNVTGAMVKGLRWEIPDYCRQCGTSTFEVKASHDPQCEVRLDRSPVCAICACGSLGGRTRHADGCPLRDPEPAAETAQDDAAEPGQEGTETPEQTEAVYDEGAAALRTARAQVGIASTADGTLTVTGFGRGLYRPVTD